jgi:hypothetical protein
MPQLSVFKEVKDAASTVLLTFKNALGFSNSRDFNDFYKKARENELSLYAIASENVPIAIYERLANGIEAKVVESIRAIVSSSVTADPNGAFDFIRNNFTNNDDNGTKLKAGIQGISDSLAENGIEIAELNIKFNESAHATGSTVIGNKRFGPHIDMGEVGEVNATYNVESPKRDSKGIDLPGHMHSVTINYITAENVAMPICLNVYLKVRVLPIDPTVLVDALVSSRNRNNFFNYIQWRAGTSSFFKGFILNLKEVEKQVKRDTSKNIAERVVGSLLSRSGFTRPLMLGEISELKNYNIILSADDADRLSREYNLNLTKPNALKTVFSNMNILSLMIVDEAKGRVVIFESDRPTEMNVISLSDLTKQDRLEKLFRNLGQ